VDEESDYAASVDGDAILMVRLTTQENGDAISDREKENKDKYHFAIIIIMSSQIMTPTKFNIINEKGSL
jgi:hypothetical protein